MKTGIKSIHAAFNLIRRISNSDVKNEELLVLPSMVEETEEPVQIHVGRTFQKVLLQRVLEIVDSFIRILQKVVLEDYIYASPVNLLLSRGPLLGASTVVMVTQSTSSSYLNQLTFPSYDGGCLAVTDKFSVSSV